MKSTIFDAPLTGLMVDTFQAMSSQLQNSESVLSYYYVQVSSVMSDFKAIGILSCLAL